MTVLYRLAELLSRAKSDLNARATVADAVRDALTEAGVDCTAPAAEHGLKVLDTELLAPAIDFDAARVMRAQARPVFLIPDLTPGPANPPPKAWIQTPDISVARPHDGAADLTGKVIGIPGPGNAPPKAGMDYSEHSGWMHPQAERIASPGFSASGPATHKLAPALISALEDALRNCLLDAVSQGMSLDAVHAALAAKIDATDAAQAHHLQDFLGRLHAP